MTRRSRGAVVLLDFLGTRRLGPDSDWGAIVDRRAALLSKIQEVDLAQLGILARADRGSPGFEFYDLEMAPVGMGFSDTIAFTVASPNQPYHVLVSIADVLSDIFLAALAAGELLRGAISIGDFYTRGPIILGPAPLAAAKYFEEARWAGIIVEPGSAEAFPDDEGAVLHYLRWKVQTKRCGSAVWWALGWPSLPLRKKYRGPSDVRERLEAFFDLAKGVAEVEEKRTATLAFYDEVVRRTLAKFARDDLLTGRSGRPP